ncbi:hypothetical protein KVT40_006953 [Elsinoe batatas]|uniref:NmrA-like domain-containing protein n=1 Tax=Elsinoe batatas TaxID=2601811 RepID=A0A8K0PE39_9PEZI|nr:hypothetical protein KVT40_006953 [Elsinoe batatas]
MKNTAPPPRAKKLAILGASGKLAYATLTSLLSHSLLPASSIVATTSALGASAPQTQKLAAHGVTVRHANFDEPDTIERALHDVEALFLVSSPRINMDFHDVQKFKGREKDHIAAIEAARRAGVKHIYYSSLGFGRPSTAGVMRAHIVTEEYLEGQSEVDWTVMREGLYNESWPLYLGHWKLGEDDRTTVKVAGDGKISWTSIPDLGLANALILAGKREEWKGKTVYLSNPREAKTLEEIAGLVSKGLGKEVKVEVVGKEEHEEFYIKEREMDEGLIKWWSSSYDALKDGECLIKDDTFEKLLSSKGLTPKSMEETVQEMVKSSS